MPVEATDALDDQVHRGEIGDKDIGVDVQTLLRNLCCNNNLSPGPAFTTMAARPEFLAHPVFLLRALPRHKACVVEFNLAGVSRVKCAICLLGAGDGVADDEGDAAVDKQRLEEFFQGGDGVVDNCDARFEIRRTLLRCDVPQRAFVGDGDEGVRI